MELSPERLLSVFEDRPNRPVPLREVIEAVNAPRSRNQAILGVLMGLVREGRLVRLRKQYFMLASSAERRAEGRIHVSSRGKGFVMGAAPNGEDLFVHTTNLGTALDGDTVEVELFDGARGDEGRVTRIVKRAHEFIVGQFTRLGLAGGTIAPRNVKIGRMIDVRNAPPRAELPDGAWVRARVVGWSSDLDDPLLTEIEDVIGLAGERGISILTLLRDMGVDPAFPAEVETEAAQWSAPTADAPPPGRLDLREAAIVTIDPATAKDFDDALSIETLENGNWRLGVHIADVAEYVRPGAALDTEALRRGTSIYPVDRVVPMLPECLSNGVCSLRPDEDRFALSCLMEITPEGLVVRHELAESLIRSRYRLSYEEAQEYFDKAAQRPEFRFADVGEDLLALRDLARALGRMRIERGALDLDLPEKQITCNAEGDTVALARHDRFESHRLVEACMLIANETVAERLKKERLPLLYRIHDLPDPASLERSAPALEMFGVRVPKNLQPTPAAYQPMVDRLNRVDGGHIGQRLILRTLMRAAYAPENRGHFGLASTCYCHFTSPIRRYPDLLVHRVIKALLRGESEDPEWRERLEGSLKSTADQSNWTAERAEQIERDAGDIKAMEFMKDQAGGHFEGWIAGIGRRGFFVELVEFPVEGFVEARSIDGDYFVSDKDRTRFVGRNTGRTYRLGQRVRVRIVRVAVDEGEMDLELIENRSGGAKPKGRGKKKGRRSRS